MNGMNATGGSRTPFLWTVLLYGSIWGLAEATFGHLLHLIRVPGLPGLFMFPFGVLVMARVLKLTGSPASVFAAGLLAAGAKFLDLLLPGTDLLAAVNPAQAIVLEALAGSAVAALFNENTVPGLHSVFRRTAKKRIGRTSPLE